MSKIAVFGVGYVGCVSGACLARDGHQVMGVDIDAGKVEMLRAGKSPVAEAGLDQLIHDQVTAGRLAATDDCQRAVDETEMAMITVGTPSARDGGVSLAAVEHVVADIGRALRGRPHDYTVVIRSTLLPGLLEGPVAAAFCDAAGRNLGPGLRLCNNPEFLRESCAIADYDDPPFVVVGVVDDWSAAEVLELYGSISAEKVVTDSRTAALLKYACNAFHATKIAFANEVGGLAKSFDADGRAVMKLLCRDTRLNVSAAYLRPGFAFGGSCLPKDLRALTRYAEQQALRIPLLGAVVPANDAHLQRAFDLIEEAGQRKIGIVGLTFKAGTDDLRESPYVTLTETLIGRGYDVRIYDPGIAVTQLRGRNLAYIDQHLPHLAALLVASPDELCQHAELLILGSPVAKDVDWKSLARVPVIDLERDLVTAGRDTAIAVDHPAAN